MHLDPYIIFADSDNCNYLWVTGNYEIRSDFHLKLMYFNQNHRWEKLFDDDTKKGYQKLINFYVNKAGIPKENFKIVRELN